MSLPQHLIRSIIQKLPDVPRWVEARDVLLSGECTIFGLREGRELSIVIQDPEDESIYVVGRPPISAVRAAIQQNVRGGSLVVASEQAAWLEQALPGWTRARIIVHTLSDPGRLPEASAAQVAFLDPEMLRRIPMPAELLEELESGAGHSLIAATFVEQQPVSFCYAGAVTESLWDVSIDTLPEHYRHGYASLCAAYMIRHMQAQGKQAVWQSLEENPASWRLAHKLGFTPVDEMAQFELRQPAA